MAKSSFSTVRVSAPRSVPSRQTMYAMPCCLHPLTGLFMMDRDVDLCEEVGLGPTATREKDG